MQPSAYITEPTHSSLPSLSSFSSPFSFNLFSSGSTTTSFWSTTIVLIVSLLVAEQTWWRYRKGHLPGHKWQIVSHRSFLPCLLASFVLDEDATSPEPSRRGDNMAPWRARTPARLMTVRARPCSRGAIGACRCEPSHHHTTIQSLEPSRFGRGRAGVHGHLGHPGYPKQRVRLNKH